MAKRAVGRPTKYKDDMPDRAYKLCRECGLTDKQLALAFGVAKSNLEDWKRKYPEFRDSIKRGRDEYDSEVVEGCLLKRARGFSYTETTKEPKTIIDKGGGCEVGKLVVTKKVRKSVAPDVTAQIFWLKNRNPARWRDKQELSVDVKSHEDALDELE